MHPPPASQQTARRRVSPFNTAQPVPPQAACFTFPTPEKGRHRGTFTCIQSRTTVLGRHTSEIAAVLRLVCKAGKSPAVDSISKACLNVQDTLKT